MQEVKYRELRRRWRKKWYNYILITLPLWGADGSGGSEGNGRRLGSVSWEWNVKNKLIKT